MACLRAGILSINKAMTRFCVFRSERGSSGIVGRIVCVL